MDIQLNSDDMKALVSEALLKSFDQEKRDTLIKGAIQHLLTPASSAYGRAKSPLEDAFNYAVTAVATQIAREMLEKDDTVKAKIRELMTASWEKIFVEGREQTITRIGEALTKGLSGGDKY